MSEQDDDQDKLAARARQTIGGDKPLIQPAKQGFFGSLWSNFLAGLVVVAPVGLTIWLFYLFLTGPMANLDSFVKRTLPVGDSTLENIVQILPGLGVLIAAVVLVILGALAKNIVGRSFIRTGERLLESVPVVRNVFGFFKNVFETALQQSDRSFKEVALIEYPRTGVWAMAFVVGQAKGEVKAALDDQGEELTALFIPTVPNPTSGFLLFMPRSSMRVLTMSVEEAAKVVFSLGLVMPEYLDPKDAVRMLEEAAAKAGVAKPKRRLFSIIGKSA